MLGLSGLACGISHGLLAPTSTALLFELQRPDEMGRSAILYHGFFGGGAGLFPYLGGFLLEEFEFRILYYLMAAVCVLSVLLHVWIQRCAEEQINRLRTPAAPERTPRSIARVILYRGSPGARTRD